MSRDVHAHVEELNAAFAARDPGRAAQVEWYVNEFGVPAMRDRADFTRANTKLIRNRRERESDRNQQRAGIGRYAEPPRPEQGDLIDG